MILLKKIVGLLFIALAAGAIPKEVKDYTPRKNCTHNIIYPNIDKSHKPLIVGTDDLKLKQHFRLDSNASTVALTDEYFSFRINPGEDMGLYTARLCTSFPKCTGASQL
ncbi:hypothetical protein CDAR_24211 [Caerostris darwini]|uniref:Uncharacterized protein n=1 Tax=Caerostris darwini TaxID=1538125 RepID=A0AAV4QG98_9ARAC|nr:hypothetical protein CDAR_24211 [Caerostris darwini]